MLSLVIGAAAFALLILSDFLMLKGRKAAAYICGFAGIFGIIGSTLLLFLFTDFNFILKNSLVPRLIAAVFALVFLCLLVYTLLFALPAVQTYFVRKKIQDLVDTGVYALSRHPGVLWLGFCYLFIWLATANVLLLWACIVFTVMDIVHVAIQDIYVFPKTIDRYDEYKKYTPFLIPTWNSVRRAVLRKRECSIGED